eukprot:scaffold323_cov414-Prasinococcus_capsulatus_cf.AAC.31
MSLGSPGWMAPETFSSENYDEKVDVYSYGVLLWELLEKKVPYEDEDYPPYAIVYKVVSEGLRPKLSNKYPEAMKQLMTDAWQDASSARPSFRQILARLKDPDGIRMEYEQFEDEFHHQAQQQQLHGSISWTPPMNRPAPPLLGPLRQQSQPVEVRESSSSIIQPPPLKQKSHIMAADEKDTAISVVLEPVPSESPEQEPAPVVGVGRSCTRSTSLSKNAEASPNVPVYLPSQEGEFARPMLILS